MSEATTTEYSQARIEELESRVTSLTAHLSRVSSQISSITDCMTASDWYSDVTDKDEVLTKLESILDFEPKQTISITATVTVYMTTDVPLRELSDFDADSFISDNLEISTYHHEANVDDWSTDIAEWEEQ